MGGVSRHPDFWEYLKRGERGAFISIIGEGFLFRRAAGLAGLVKGRGGRKNRMFHGDGCFMVLGTSGEVVCLCSRRVR